MPDVFSFALVVVGLLNGVATLQMGMENVSSFALVVVELSNGVATLQIDKVAEARMH